MTIIRASVLGYCMGVKRAVEAADRELEKRVDSSVEQGHVYSLGPLIHNPVVLKSLAEKGLTLLDDADVKAGLVNEGESVVVRAHGTTPALLRALEARRVCVVDATCPRVHLSQKRAFEWASKGWNVVLAGDRNHGEVISITGYAEDGAVAFCARESNSFPGVYVVQNCQEAACLLESGKVGHNTVLLAQTTFSENEFAMISELMTKALPGMRVFNSICSATRERQNALLELKGRVQGILVIGGMNSANTKRLYSTACTICGTCALIEDASDIPEKFFSLETVGLTAGASTPDQIISRVEERLVSCALN